MSLIGALPTATVPDPASTAAIFLSYARDDAAAARRIAEALRAGGLEVWFDENELRGGDAWDAKIRKQIDACTLFVPIISKHTEARAKGYFRLEWKLAVDQTHLLAEGVPFIAPVVIDHTNEKGARVPAEFLRVQWTRLPDALPTPQLVGQMRRLLERTPTAAMTAAPIPMRTAPAFETTPPAPEVGRLFRARPWAIAGVAILVAALIAGWWLLRPTVPVPDSAAGRSAAPPAEKSAAPTSEARQLVAKARALYEPWDLASREDFALAEQLLKKATDLDPSDAEAWAHAALVSCGMVVINFDTSEERRSAARAQAEHAFKLAPDSGQARFARAFSLRFSPQTQDEAVRLLQEEAARQPTNRMVLRTLGATLRVLRQFEQSLIYLDKAAALPGSDPVTLYNRAMTLHNMERLAEAEAAFDETLALAPNFSKAAARKVSLLLDYHGDLEGARSLLKRIAPEYFTTDGGANLAATVWLYSRDSAKCLEVLRPAHDFLQAGTYTGPKAYLTGMAHHLAGNVAAARSDWRGALRVVEQRMASQPNSSMLLWWKAVLTAALGEVSEAETLLQEIRQRMNSGDPYFTGVRVARILALMGKKDEAIAALESGRKLAPANAVTSGGLYVFRNILRYDPVWDSLRGNPRFEALLKVAEPALKK